MFSLLFRRSAATSSLFSAGARVRFCTTITTTTSSTVKVPEHDEATSDVESVVTASAIARTLRNYREAHPESVANDNNNNNSWVDLEMLMSSQYLSRLDFSAQQQQQHQRPQQNQQTQQQLAKSFAAKTPALRPLQTAEEIISGSAVFRAAGLELKPQLLVRRKPHRRTAHVFVDADGLTPERTQPIIARLRLHPENSTVVVARQPTATPLFGKALAAQCQMPLSMFHDDVVAPYCASVFKAAPLMSSATPKSAVAAVAGAGEHNDNNANNTSSSSSSIASSGNALKTYMLVEKLATKLLLAQTVVLDDVVYVCSDDMFGLYCKHVSQATPFLDADVFVFSPSHSEQVYAKSVMPTISATVVAPPLA